MNVAADLRNFGINSQLVSRVGSDDLGRELLDFLGQKGLPLNLIQIGQTHLTGVAKANISDSNEVTYKIVQPVAWDYIHLEPALLEVVRNSDFFVYGSLAARSPQTHETLMALLAVAPRKVFDVNLRAPHYNRAIVEELLNQATIAKLNEHELVELASWYGEENDLHRAMHQLRNQFKLDKLIVTLGEHGAVLLDKAGLHSQVGFPVDVADTIGSGDAFLAAFLYQTIQGASPQKTLEFACATGSYVATQHGATPSFSEETIISTILSTTAM